MTKMPATMDAANTVQPFSPNVGTLNARQSVTKQALDVVGPDVEDLETSPRSRPFIQNWFPNLLVKAWGRDP